jgi:tRNA threonylcarbamoyladenosine biosynthesis protein TsaB
LAVLVVDTCLAACQVAVFEGPRMVAGASEAMERGHQERLATMTREVMARAGVGFEALDKIVVTTGPGSFTGLRVGLAFAKGLRLATGAPLAGIGTLAALAASADGGAPATGVVDARRGLVYVQAFAGGAALAEPDILPLADAAARLLPLAGLRLVGPGAALLAQLLPDAEILARPAPDLAALGRLAIAAVAEADVRPLYLRAPDARPLAVP